MLLFLFFFVAIFSLSWKIWPQLGCKYASFAFLVYVDLNLIKGNLKILQLWAPDRARIIGKVFGSWIE